MRSLTSPSLAALLALFTVAPLLAQDDPSPVDSIRPVVIVESGVRSFDIYAEGGVAPVAHEAISSSLEEAGLGASRVTEDLAGGTAFIGIGTRADIGLLFADARLRAFVPQGNRTGSEEVTLTTWAIGAMVGRSVPIGGDRFTLWPFLALSSRSSTLTISDARATTFGGAVNGDSRSVVLSNTASDLTVGVGADVALRVQETEASLVDLTIGARAGYAIGFAGDRWRVADAGTFLESGPDMAANGPELALLLGLRTRPRIYSARIIAPQDSSTIPSFGVVHPALEAQYAHLADDSAAMRLRYGVRAGWNHSWSHDLDQRADRPPFTSYGPLDAFNVGVVANIPLTGWLSVQPELGYGAKGGEQIEYMVGPFDSTHTFTTRYDAGYVELPATAKVHLRLGRALAVTAHGGIYASALAGSSLEYRRDYPSMIDNGVARPARTVVSDGNADLDAFELGSVWGLGLELTLWDRIVGVDLRLTSDFGEAQRSGPQLRNNVASVTGAVLF